MGRGNRHRLVRDTKIQKALKSPSNVDGKKVTSHFIDQLYNGALPTRIP